MAYYLHSELADILFYLANLCQKNSKTVKLDTDYLSDFDSDFVIVLIKILYTKDTLYYNFLQDFSNG